MQIALSTNAKTAFVRFVCGHETSRSIPSGQGGTWKTPSNARFLQKIARACCPACKSANVPVVTRHGATA